MAIKPEPRRLHRTDWWATWKGSAHYVGHDTWITFDRATGEIWYIDRDPGDAADTPRALRSVELLRATNIMLIQADGPDHRSFNGWRYAAEVSDLEIRGTDAGGPFWIKCRLHILRPGR